MRLTHICYAKSTLEIPLKRHYIHMMMTIKAFLGIALVASATTGLLLQVVLATAGSFLILWAFHDLIMANELE
jgi:hypothetical protein